MQPVQDMQAYKDLISQNKNRFAKTITNSMLMPDTLRKYIARGSLYSLLLADGLLLYVDEGKYYTLYYFWDSQKPFSFPGQDKPVLVEELNNRGSRDAHIAHVHPMLLACGFTRARHNVQVERSVPPAMPCPLPPEGFTLAYASQEVLPQVFSLWEAHLEPTDVPVEHLQPDAQAVILNVLTPSHTVAATNFWQNHGKVSECRHTVTAPAIISADLPRCLYAAGFMIRQLWAYSAGSHGSGKLTPLLFLYLASMALCPAVKPVHNIYSYKGAIYGPDLKYFAGDPRRCRLCQ